MYRLLWFIAVLVLAALACSLPGQQASQRLEVMEVSVTPSSGNGSFTGTVVYTPGVFAEKVECRYMNVDTGFLIDDFSHVIILPGDENLVFAETQASFEFKVTKPGKYRLYCDRTAVKLDALALKAADFTVVAAAQFARLILQTDQDIQTPALDLVLSTWCLHPTAFPPTSPDDPALIKVSETGKLEGSCAVSANDMGLMPHQSTLTGQFNRTTNEVTFDLIVTWDDPTSGVHAEQVLTGSGSAAPSGGAMGTAVFTITCTDGMGNPDYEPLGCYGEYGGPYWDSYTVTGTVPWMMEFAP